MSIYLTSYGIDTRYSDYMNSYDDIINVLKDKKVVIIPNAHLLNEDRTNFKPARTIWTCNDGANSFGMYV